MVLDYSKWDKLELSDDSDIEVHPNVDKNSFIRWKQRDIHEKREQAKFRLLQLEVNIETNENLLRRVNKLIEAGESGRKIGLDVDSDVKFSQEGEAMEKPSKATSPEQPRYTDMIESMLMQVVAENGDPDVVLSKLKEHKDMIANALVEENKELQKLQEERKQHITAEDIHTGWDSTIVYKSDQQTTKESKTEPTAGIQATTLETLNNPPARPIPKTNEDGLEELLPQTKEFGLIKKGDLEATYKFLMKNPFIVTEGQKDALMMSAFEHELGEDSKLAEQTVWNALLIQYCLALGKDGIRLFFSKIVKADHPARGTFEQDVQTTYTHIRGRCKILQEDHTKSLGGEETIQLHPVDEETDLVIKVPEIGSEGRHIYDAMSEDVRRAISTRKLDEINEVLRKMSVSEAETLVEQLGESGVLQVENKIYEPEEWESKKASMAPDHKPTIDDVD